MDTSYRLGRRQRRRHQIGGVVIVVITLATAIATAYFYHDASKNTGITMSSTETKTAEVTDTTPKKTVSGQTFTMQLPADWKEIGRGSDPYRYIEWQDTAKATTARSLRLYIDSIPRDMAVNRLLPLEVAGPGLTPGEVSNNCSHFVGPGNITPKVASRLKPTQAKWQNVAFICDLPNYLREVVGTGSPEGINVVSANGPAAGKHRYFFVYTDHTAQPNFTILTTIINGFMAK